MAVLLALISQKGGVSKSTLARLIAREYANAGWNVKIADLDVSQGTSFHWQGRRLQAAVTLLTQSEAGRRRGWGRSGASHDEPTEPPVVTMRWVDGPKPN